MPFSHEHHVRGLGIDCRYCHTSVETSSFAGHAADGDVHDCHSQIWADSPMLEPVRESLQDGQPIRWNRVHDLPDFVYFNHGIHVQKGVGCVELPRPGRPDAADLEGRADDDGVVPGLPPPSREAPPPQGRGLQHGLGAAARPAVALGGELVRRYHIAVERLTNCSMCHR